MVRTVIASMLMIFLIASIVSADVVGLWLFDEGQGDTVRDASGNGNDGVIEGAEWVDGKFGEALMFDGETTRVVIPSSDSLNVPDQVTVEAWIFPTELHDDINAIAQKWGDISNRRQYQLGVIDADGTARFYISHSGTDHQRPIGAGIPANEWTHIAGTFDGEVIRVFINGAFSEKLDSPGGSISVDYAKLILPGFEALPQQVLPDSERAGASSFSQWSKRVAVHTRPDSEEFQEVSAFIPEGQMELPFPMPPHPN